MPRISILFATFLVCLQPFHGFAEKQDHFIYTTIFRLECQQFDVNRIWNYFTNIGELTTCRVTGNAGLYWPGGSASTAIFQSGLWIAGKVDGEIRTAAVEYSSEFLPGKVKYDSVGAMQPGIADDPSALRYKIYVIKYGDTSDRTSPNFNSDYLNWPISDGAPGHDGEYFIDFNNNGTYDETETFEDFNRNGQYDPPDGVIIEGQDPPRHIGDRTYWYVCNDLDEETHEMLWHTEPLYLEVQTTMWGFNTSLTEDIMYVKWLIVNKSGKTIEDAYFSIWSDPDIGDAHDDYVGCDTSLGLGYCYNGDADDQIYGYTPPCVGYELIQGPIVPSIGDSILFAGNWLSNYKNLSMTSFLKYSCGSIEYTCPDKAQEAYYNMSGMTISGSNWFDPDSEITKFLYPGDPVTRQGHTEFDDDTPGDRYFLLSSGPFDMPSWQDLNQNGSPEVGEPGVQKIVCAVLIGQGSNNLNSITVMKNLSKTATYFYSEQDDIYQSDIHHPTDDMIPVNFRFDSAHPNPFNPATTFRYQLPEQALVEISAYNLLGQEVKRLVREQKPAGKYSIVWNAENLPSGIYLIRMTAGDFHEVQKCVLLK